MAKKQKGRDIQFDVVTIARWDDKVPTLEDGTIDYDHLPITRRKRNMKAEKALAKAELRLQLDVEKKLDDALKNAKAAKTAKKEKPKKDAPESGQKNYLPPKPFPYNVTQMRRMIKNALRKYEQRIATLEKQMDDISATGTFMRGQIRAYEEVMLDLVQWIDE